MPGMPKIHSMITAPPAMPATCRPSTVTTGISAFFSACLSTTTRPRNPLAAAVRT